MKRYELFRLECETEHILEKIDCAFENLDLENIDHKNFAIGAGGILAYFVLRLAACKQQPACISPKTLAKSACRILGNKDADLTSTYYALLYLDLQKRGVKDAYIPRLSKWLPKSYVLPKNHKYWKPFLYGGCIGTAARKIENEILAVEMQHPDINVGTPDNYSI